MDLVLVGFIGGAVLGAIGGYLLATHIHSVAKSATSAAVRATTIPASAEHYLSAAPILGDPIKTAVGDVQKAAVSAIDHAETIPKG